MVHDSVKIGVQSSAVTYGALKDIFFYFSDRKALIKRLEVNLKNLNTQMVLMKSREKKIDGELKASVSKEETGEYKMFITLIKDAEKRFDELQHKYQQLRGKFSSVSKEFDALFARDVILNELPNRKPIVWSPKFWELAKLSKRIVELTESITGFMKNLSDENMMVEKRPGDVRVRFPGICDLQKQIGDVQLILIKWRTENVIGITGPTGIGKTTILRKLYNEVNDGKTIVIWIDYPTGRDKEKVVGAIQKEIIEQLKIATDGTKSNTLNRMNISQFLQDVKYYLLIDNVSSHIDLDMIGISQDNKDRNIVLATRAKSSIDHIIDSEVKLVSLEEEDARVLFESYCGSIPGGRIKDIADLIIKICGGLPEAIKLVGKYLKGVNVERIWNGVKRKLQCDLPTEIDGLEVIAASYQMMYHSLKEDHTKKCSLYGALFPNKHKICNDYLIECWKGEGFLCEKNDKYDLDMGTARENGAIVLKELINVDLMEAYSHEKYDSRYVQMPINFRKVALALSNSDENSKIWVSMPMHKFPKEEDWNTTRRMSLISQSLDEPCAEGTSHSLKRSNLPIHPQCNNISTLLLQLNPSLERLEDDFFKSMKTLQVLDLHQTHITSLPSSISCLKELMCLYVNQCSFLGTLPDDVANLSKLEILDIRKTQISPWLPNQISNMCNLSCLRVSFDEKENDHSGENINTLTPSKIISNLKKLEELTIETAVGSKGWEIIVDEIVHVLANLNRLTTLRLNFPNVDSLQTFVSLSTSGAIGNSTRVLFQLKDLRSFRFFVGCPTVSNSFIPDIYGISAERYLRFYSNGKKTPSAVLEVLKQATAFELIDHSYAKSLTELNFCNMGSLEVCCIRNCKSLETIVDAHKFNEMADSGEINDDNGGILGNIKMLLLYDLRSLQSIWRGNFMANSFSSLIVLKIYNCRVLTEITVDIWTLLEEIEIKGCENLIKLSLTSENAKNLSSIVCEESWWATLELLDKDKDHFVRICHFQHKNVAPKLKAEDNLDNGIAPLTPLTGKDGRSSNEEMDRKGMSSFRWPWSKKLLEGSQIYGNDQLFPAETSGTKDHDPKSNGCGPIIGLQDPKTRDLRTSGEEQDIQNHNSSLQLNNPNIGTSEIVASTKTTIETRTFPENQMIQEIETSNGDTYN